MKRALSLAWAGVRFIGRGLGVAGRATVALVGIAGVVVALANYNMTIPGTGTSFGSIVVSTVHYAQQLICDPTTPSQCQAVNSSGQASVAVASLPLPSGAATAANQSTEISSLSTIATNTGGPVPLNVNTTTTAQTGLTPGTAQTGTIVAANTDQTSLGGVAYGAMANFGASPGAVKAPNSNAFNFVTDQVGGGIAALEGDPCQTTAKSYLPITATTSLVKVIATGVASKKIYVCQLLLTVTAADNVAVFEATTGTTCATSAVAVFGAGTSVATAANGFPFPANGGVSLGNGGFEIAQTSVNNNDLCIGTSAATPLTGGITYVTR